MPENTGKKEKYIVVLENISDTGFKGLRTWFEFSSQEEFKKFYVGSTKKTHRVMAQGISEAEAKKLCLDIPIFDFARIVEAEVKKENISDPNSYLIIATQALLDARHALLIEKVLHISTP